MWWLIFYLYECFGVVVLQMLDENEGIHHSPIFLAEKPKGCCLVCPWFLSREENPKAGAFLIGLVVVCLGWPENDFFWVLFKTILLHFRFLFAWFGRKTQRLLLVCFLFREENPKAETFWLGLAVLYLGWLENDFWILFNSLFSLSTLSPIGIFLFSLLCSPLFFFFSFFLKMIFCHFCYKSCC